MKKSTVFGLMGTGLVMFGFGTGVGMIFGMPLIAFALNGDGDFAWVLGVLLWIAIGFVFILVGVRLLKEAANQEEKELEAAKA